jgi:hypothetical protein
MDILALQPDRVVFKNAGPISFEQVSFATSWLQACCLRAFVAYRWLDSKMEKKNARMRSISAKRLRPTIHVADRMFFNRMGWLS